MFLMMICLFVRRLDPGSLCDALMMIASVTASAPQKLTPVLPEHEKEKDKKQLLSCDALQDASTPGIPPL